MTETTAMTNTASPPTAEQPVTESQPQAQLQKAETGGSPQPEAHAQPDRVSKSPGAAGGSSGSARETLPMPAPPTLSSSSPPPLPSSTTHAQATETAPTGAPHGEGISEVPADGQPRPLNPQIADLQAMFPDYDVAILQSVLESVNGDQSRAIDALLGMTDPNYKSEEPHHAPLPPTLSQTELDEQLARRLMLEEQEAHQAAWEAQQQQYNSPVPQAYPRQQQQYQRPPQGDAGTAQGGDTMAEMQQHFNRIAESGKKTFGNFISKVKAKIQEFDSPRPPQSSAAGMQPTWDTSGGAGGTPYAPYQPFNEHAQAQTGYVSQQPAYYDPNAHSSVVSPPQSFTSTTSHSLPELAQQSKTSAPALAGYDATPDPPAAAQAPGATKAQAPTFSPSPPVGGSATNQAVPKVDGGKFGILPKRPVSLLPQQSHSSSSPQIQRKYSEDDDGLEYAESPFEEPKK